MSRGRIYIEKRKLEGRLSLSADIARHLQTRYRLGSVLIVVDAPQAMLAALCKQWASFVRTAELQLARTTDPIRKAELRRQLERAQRLSFAASGNADLLWADVFVVSITQIDIVQKECTTAYLATADIISDDVPRLEEKITQHGLLVAYPPADKVLHGHQA